MKSSRPKPCLQPVQMWTISCCSARRRHRLRQNYLSGQRGSVPFRQPPGVHQQREEIQQTFCSELRPQVAAPAREFCDRRLSFGVLSSRLQSRRNASYSLAPRRAVARFARGFVISRTAKPQVPFSSMRVTAIGAATRLTPPLAWHFGTQRFIDITIWIG